MDSGMPEDRETLALLGFDDRWRTRHQEDLPPGAAWGRVLADYGTAYRVMWEVPGTGLLASEGRPKGRAWQAAGLLRPAVGDYVAGEPDTGRMLLVLPRRTNLVRKNPGPVPVAQVLAANVDRVFVLVPMTGPPRLNRLERSAAMVWDGGAEPVVVATKRDLCPDPTGFLAAVQGRLPHVPAVALSALTGESLEALVPWLEPGTTVALLGPSGAGKSTLINAWVPDAGQRVEAVRAEDGRGRHTTTHRELFRLPAGALVADLPGLREMERWEGEGAITLFDGLEQLAASCRFSDCRHDREPGCAVREAVDAGTLDEARLQHYAKLQREEAFLERKRSKEARAAWKADHRGCWRAVRDRERVSAKRAADDARR